MNKKQLLAKCKDLGIETSGLDTNAKLKAAIEAKEAEMAEKESAEAEAEKPEAEAKEEAPAKEVSKEQETEGFWEDENGLKWVFKKNAPKTLNIDGHSLTREEILNSEEIISELVYGKCPHLTRKQ
jgi:hypothetical protein